MTTANAPASPPDLLARPPRVVNIGLERFAQDLLGQGARAIHVAWSPPSVAVRSAALPAALMFSTVFYVSLYFTFADCFELEPADTTDG